MKQTLRPAPSIICKISFAFLILSGVLSAVAQEASALRRQNEEKLARSGTALAAAPGGEQKADALKEKGMALDSLGRHAEALAALREASALAPDDYSVQLHTAIALDSNGDHDAAREAYDRLFLRLQDWRAARTAVLKSGAKPPAGPAESAILAVGLAAPEASAFNYVFLGKYDRALAQFTRNYETRLMTFGPGADSDYSALWRIWLTAKGRANDGLRAGTALELLIKSLKVSTPWHEAMLKYYEGKATLDDVFAAIDALQSTDAEKENALTEARFFAAGYLRYIKRDNAAALELLQTEDARPFNGCVERLFIRDEIASIRRQAEAI